ncbi:MAG: ornithine carbamoyltransferase [Chloroflexi bacterium]|nr:ornithine carbamoyltransferase [Chloroflexota bacterium]
MKNFINFSDIKYQSIIDLLDTALEFKSGRKSNNLSNKTAVLLFEKPSLRTKLSFWKSVQFLNGNPIYFGPEEVGLDKRESIKDVANVIGQMADLAIIRTFSHESLNQFTKFSEIPVINALSDGEHPCQALADILTMYEIHKNINSISVAFIGDANNVAKSLAFAISGIGGTLNLASPPGYGFKKNTIQKINDFGSGTINQIENPFEAVKNCDFVYTDVWTSMGQEKQTKLRLKKFHGYQVNEKILDSAKKNVYFMHDLPAHHGEEISDGLLYDSRSIVFKQAENRIWAQIALIDKIFSLNNY